MSGVRVVPGVALRVVLLAVALGVVGMHHLAGGHQHGSTTPMAEHHMAVAEHHTAVAARPLPPRFTDPAPEHGDGGLQHLCLAILGAATALLALVLLGFPTTVPSTGRLGPCAATTGHSRAPPAPRRLAELQVLRV